MTKEYRHAIIIGKFYPPHVGHLHLIREAARIADLVTVIVYGSRYFSISAETRVGWMRTDLDIDSPNVELFPVESDIYEDYNSDIIWDAHMAHLQAFLRAHNLDGAFDVVVASEDYAAVMAKEYFGGIASHVVDTERTTFPISATAFRADAPANWNYLIPAARRAIMPRIIVLGSESTGTTTLSQAIAEHYNARWVPEYGADYTRKLIADGQKANKDFTTFDVKWTPSDFKSIGRQQYVMEDDAVMAQDDRFPLFVGDTDSLATAIWEKRYYPNLTVKEALTRDYVQNLSPRALYIVTDHQGVEYEQNDIRDGEDIREAMTTDFEDALALRNESWIKLRGTPEERLDAAIHMIDGIIATTFEFSDPKRIAR